MTPAEQKRRRTELWSLLGDLPDRRRKITAESLGIERRETYAIERLVLDLNGIERVPAVFTRPLEGDGPVPAILYNHVHGGLYDLGKRELTEGCHALQPRPYAEELARRGIAALCIDAWNFGERRGRKESELFKEMLWRGQVLWGMMVFDAVRAVEYLCGRSDVDAGRIGTLGLSLGSTTAWWLAALEERVKVCVDLCCLTDYQALLETRGLDGHGLYYYVPSLLKHFTTAQINALIAPRPHLGLAGNFDSLTPPAGLDRIDRELRKVYRACGAPRAWKLLRYDVGHMETAEMRARIVEFLDDHL